MNQVNQMLKAFDRLVSQFNPKYYLRRFYNSEAAPTGTKFRPLASPAKSARMFMYLLNCFLSIYVSGFLSKHQHAFQKGKGTGTAWRDVAKQLRADPDYIYEFDLKQCFPSFNTQYVCWVLRERLGVPNEISGFLFDQGLQYPVLESLDEDTLDETNALHKAEMDALGLLRGTRNPDRVTLPKFIFDEKGKYKGKVLAPIFDFIKENGEDLLVMLICEDFQIDEATLRRSWYKYLYMYYLTQAALFEQFQPRRTETPGPGDTATGKSPFKLDLAPLSPTPGAVLPGFAVHVLDHFKGFAQGSALSVTLSVVGIEYGLHRGHFMMIAKDKGVKIIVVFYADDFIVFVWGAITEAELIQRNIVLEAMGINFNLAKSKWIKQGEEWSADKFKFLGVTFYPKDDIIIGTPRNGTDTLYTFEEPVAAFAQRDLELRKISKVLKWEASPQEILDGWAEGTYPFALVPTSLMEEAQPLNAKQWAWLKKANAKSLEDPSYEVPSKGKPMQVPDIASWILPPIWSPDSAAKAAPSGPFRFAENAVIYTDPNGIEWQSNISQAVHTTCRYSPWQRVSHLTVTSLGRAEDARLEAQLDAQLASINAGISTPLSGAEIVEASGLRPETATGSLAQSQATEHLVPDNELSSMTEIMVPDGPMSPDPYGSDPLGPLPSAELLNLEEIGEASSDTPFVLDPESDTSSFKVGRPFSRRSYSQPWKGHLSFLRTRLTGYVMSRLYAGQTVTSQDACNFLQDFLHTKHAWVNPQGPSWLELVRNSKAPGNPFRDLTGTNASSVATLHLLEILSKPLKGFGKRRNVAFRRFPNFTRRPPSDD